MPPPDVLIIQWFPLNCWRVPVAIRRVAEHPEWAYWAARHDVGDTIDAAYDGMLAWLGLTKPEYGAADDVHRWMREWQALERLKFYALLNNADGFHATYQELKRQQNTSVATEVRAILDEITRDTLPTPRPVFICAGRPDGDVLAQPVPECPCRVIGTRPARATTPLE